MFLGRIGATTIAGGRLALDPVAAATAIGRLAVALGVTPVDAAIAILDVADSAMIQANRLMTIRRGHDPAEFDLIAFGGAGPLHACRQAMALGFRSVIVPPDAGVLSAFGLLASVARVDHRMAFRRRLDSLDPAEADDALRRIEVEAIDRLPPGVRDGELQYDRAVDARYVGQSWDLRVPVATGPFDSVAAARLRDDFDALHERTYGYAARTAPVETVHVAITVSAPRAGGWAAAPGATPRSAREAVAPDGSRRAYVDDTTGLADVPVHVLAGLHPGDALAGPALIDGTDSTTFVARGFTCRVGPDHVLHLVARAS
jgi:N-methylhydantoinase A